MVVVHSRNTVVNVVSLILALFVLSGCLEKQENGFADSIGDPITLTGSVGDGPIVNADMRVLGNSGDVLAAFLSDSTANYSVTVDVVGNNFPLIVDATGGTDLVTGLGPDFRLVSTVLSANEQTTANLNPFSTMIVALAEQMDGGLVAGNMVSAEDIVVAELNSGLNEIAANGVLRSAINDSNLAEIVKSSETLAEMFRRTSKRLNDSGFPVSIDDFIAVIAADLTDGVVDGRGAAGADPRTSAVAVLVYGQVLLEAMANELRVDGRNVAAAMNDAIVRVGNAPVRFVEDLPVTDRMIAKARVALAAAYAVTQDPSIRELHTAVSGMRGGMDATLIRSLMPPNFDTRMDAILGIIASSDNATIELVNEVARTDGTIEAGNRQPQIAGLPATAVAPGSDYMFVPEATDPDGDVLSFQGGNIPGWASFDTMTGTISGRPGTDDIGSYSDVTITVSDGELAATLDPFTITVTTGNSPPVISGSPPRSVLAGDTYAFTPAASDPDDDALTFSISNRPAWASFDVTTGTLSGMPGDADAGQYGNIVITVTDGELTASLAAFSINVTIANSPPTISGSPPRTVTVGQSYSFTPTASDTDGDTLTFSISNKPPWASFDTATGTLSGAPVDTDAGQHGNIVITVTDGVLTDSLAPFAIEVSVANSPPTIDGSPQQTVIVGQAYSFTPTAGDTDGDALLFTISNRPAWASFDSATGAISGTPAPGDVGNYSDVNITVSDGELTDTLGPFTITVTTSNSPPVISGSPPGTVAAGVGYTFTPTASDPDDDTISFSISNKPAWASFNTTTGRLSGTPGNADAGQYGNIVITVTDGELTDSLAAFTIEVTAVNSPPTIGGSPPSTVTAGQAYSFTPTASDPDDDTLSFSISNRPAWASFDTATGAIGGTPGAGDAGSYSNVTITVSDGEFTDTLGPFTISVTVDNSPPVISGSPPGAVVAGDTYTFTPTASDPDDDTLSFSISNRPSWAAFNTTTGTLSGTPDNGDAGQYGNIRITVTDGELTDGLAAFTIEVTAVNSPPTIGGSPPRTVTAGQSYSFTPTSSDPDGDDLTFTVANLPSWATFDSSTGTVTGIPADADVGNYTGVRVTVSDGTDTASLQWSVEVEAVSLGSLTLSWTAPTRNTDGTQLTDLAGYRIYWGRTSGNYTESVTVDNPGLTSYVVENLSSGTYEFVTTSFNTSGVESEMSAPATGTVP
jgi:hypothetical protein